jgi:pimeloyl-ACP methyl ester carboxylesterase
MHIFKSDGTEIRYRIEGSGENFLFCWHGFGGGPSDYQEVLPLFAKNSSIVIPNLKHFFSSDFRTTFSQHVSYAVNFLEQICDVHRPKKIRMIGHSYGATLSLAMRLKLTIPVDGHWLLNPMPFAPISLVKNGKIAKLLSQLERHDGFRDYVQSAEGRDQVFEAARVFRIGTAGQNEIQRFNERKFVLVEKAMDRFLWIDRNEDWPRWEANVRNISDHTIDRVIYSDHDSLFSVTDYQSFIQKIRPKKSQAVAHNGHLILQDKWQEIFQQES